MNCGTSAGLPQAGPRGRCARSSTPQASPPPRGLRPDTESPVGSRCRPKGCAARRSAVCKTDWAGPRSARPDQPRGSILRPHPEAVARAVLVDTDGDAIHGVGADHRVVEIHRTGVDGDLVRHVPAGRRIPLAVGGVDDLAAHLDIAVALGAVVVRQAQADRALLVVAAEVELVLRVAEHLQARLARHRAGLGIGVGVVHDGAEAGAAKGLLPLQLEALDVGAVVGVVRPLHGQRLAAHDLGLGRLVGEGVELLHEEGARQQGRIGVVPLGAELGLVGMHRLEQRVAGIGLGQHGAVATQARAEQVEGLAGHGAGDGATQQHFLAQLIGGIEVGQGVGVGVLDAGGREAAAGIAQEAVRGLLGAHHAQAEVAAQLADRKVRPAVDGRDALLDAVVLVRHVLVGHRLVVHRDGLAGHQAVVEPSVLRQRVRGGRLLAEQRRGAGGQVRQRERLPARRGRAGGALGALVLQRVVTDLGTELDGGDRAVVDVEGHVALGVVLLALHAAHAVVTGLERQGLGVQRADVEVFDAVVVGAEADLGAGVALHPEVAVVRAAALAGRGAQLAVQLPVAGLVVAIEIGHAGLDIALAVDRLEGHAGLGADRAAHQRLAAVRRGDELRVGDADDAAHRQAAGLPEVVLVVVVHLHVRIHQVQDDVGGRVGLELQGQVGGGALALLAEDGRATAPGGVGIGDIAVLVLDVVLAVGELLQAVAAHVALLAADGQQHAEGLVVALPVQQARQLRVGLARQLAVHGLGRGLHGELILEGQRPARLDDDEAADRAFVQVGRRALEHVQAADDFGGQHVVVEAAGLRLVEPPFRRGHGLAVELRHVEVLVRAADEDGLAFTPDPVHRDAGHALQRVGHVLVGELAHVLGADRVDDIAGLALLGQVFLQRGPHAADLDRLELLGAARRGGRFLRHGRRDGGASQRQTDEMGQKVLLEMRLGHVVLLGNEFCRTTRRPCRQTPYRHRHGSQRPGAGLSPCSTPNLCQQSSGAAPPGRTTLRFVGLHCADVTWAQDCLRSRA
mmetsp:Transcript_4941/g.17796  ORF Transcript_4941/g.17796 Transcript_4941/m.17796 type:complete len:1023 (+) Transcript_4941:620-3688(+)